MVYEALKDVILNTGYDLEETLDKIYVMYSKGRLSKEQMEELEELARENAKTDNSIDVINKLKEIDLRLKNCETEIASLKETEENPEEPTEEVVYPVYVPGKWYYKDDKCSENGKNYICIAPEGQVCTWSPSEYPAYWQEVAIENEIATEEVTEEE